MEVVTERFGRLLAEETGKLRVLIAEETARFDARFAELPARFDARFAQLPARFAQQCEDLLKWSFLAAGLKPGETMIALKYSLAIEATEDPDFFGFYSPDLRASSQSPRDRARLSTTTKSQWGTTTDVCWI